MAEPTGRSLRLWAEQQAKANAALSNFGTKAELAAALQMSRTTINNFFKGEPVQVKQFHTICKKLKLNWQPENFDIDELVQQVRLRLLPFITAPDSPIGTMRMFSVNRPVPVDKIYIDLNVLEQLSCSSHSSDWRQDFNPNNRQDFDRFGLSRVQKRVEALSVVKDYLKLMVVGKPGAGKTTFLKSLAVECIQPEKELFAELVPLFVTLREFAKEARRTQSWKLLDYLTWLLAEQWKGCDRASAEKILTQGRSLVLLDGLDEVPPDDLQNVLDAVREFGYRVNRLVITCRTHSPQELDGFTDVEVADFKPEQVDRFVENWFKIVDSGSQASLAPKLQQLLRQIENKPIAELTITPVLLNLICAVFRDEQGNLPKKRFQLYEKGMRQLLERIERRTPIDERLTIDVKEEFLAELALTLFEKNDYFPEQQTLEKFIRDYFGVERSVATKILKAFETETGLLIERSAGYWSFSHLTFQEYLVAQWYVQHQDWQRLARHVCDLGWRQVFWLAAEMVQPVDDLLWAMKREIDALIKNDNKLQQFIDWVQEKAHSVSNARYNPAAVRAFYFYFANLQFSCIQELIHPNRDILAYAIDPRFRGDMSNAYAQRAGIFIFVFSLPNDIAIDIALAFIFDDDIALPFALRAIELIFKLELTPQFKVELQFLVSLFPPRFQDWGKEKWETWLTCFKQIMIEHRKIGYDWQLTKKQKEQLQRYYDANKFLVEFMKQPPVESEAVRGAIEETLLLPIAKIEKRQGDNR